MLLSHFKSVLGTPHDDEYNGKRKVSELVRFRVNESQCTSLGESVTEEEIREVFWSLKNGKAPGPDGYSVGFFKGAWDVVGQEVVAAIKSFFSSGELLKEINSTTIALVPKIPNPERVGDYRPISCCNAIYKCISKILANRIKKVLPDLIDPVQSAFVPGRRISDNIFLSQELLRGYHRDSKDPRCAMKIDIMKAYDNVRWDFLFDTLEAMGFPEKFINWVKACVTSPSYSICINGNLNGYFMGRKGLRQGDPLSPYLFVIVMEMLTRILAEKACNGQFKFLSTSP